MDRHHLRHPRGGFEGNDRLLGYRVDDIDNHVLLSVHVGKDLTVGTGLHSTKGYL